MDMDRLFQDVKAHLQDLDHSQRMTLTHLDSMYLRLTRSLDTRRESKDRLCSGVTREVGQPRTSVTLWSAAIVGLGEAFDKLEQAFRDQEQRIAALEKQRDPAV